MVDRTFGLLLSEDVRCTVPTCTKVTHSVPKHVEYYLIVTATALRNLPLAMDDGERPGRSGVCAVQMMHVTRTTGPRFCRASAMAEGHGA